MKKLSFRVSGARLGDTVRPAAAVVDADTVVVAPSALRFGLRVHRVPPPVVVAPLTRDDYATAEDYE